MKAKDQFIEWLREKVLQNPQEPPATAWEEISHSLDLEESWEKIGEELELNSVWDRIDTQLDRLYNLRRFERFSYGVSAAAASILLLFLWGLEPSYFPGQENTQSSLTENQPILTKELSPAGNSSSSGEKNSPMMEAKSEISTKGSENESTEVESISLVSGKEALNLKPAASLKKKSVGEPAPPSLMAGDKELAKALTAHSHAIVAGIPLVAILEVEEEEFIPKVPHVVKELKEVGVATEKHGRYLTAYAGLGSALKISWLLNNKTLQALESTSLLTAAPNVQNDLFLMYGSQLRSNLLWQADIYIKDRVGQEYKEYRNGQFGKVEEKLEYQSLALNLSQVRNQVAYGRFSTYSRLSGGIYGGRLKSARELSQNEILSRTEEYSRWHAGVLAGYEYDTFLSDHFIFTYGVRSRFDLLNIYSGTDQLSMAFRRTRAFSLDFSVSLKYVLKK